MLPVALMILVAVLASLGGWVIVRVMIGDRAKGRRRCPKCWYDMQGSPTLVCPECGHDAVDPKRLSLTRRRDRRVVVGLLLIAMAWYAREVSYRVKFENEPISTAAVPTTWYAIAYPALDHPTRLVLIERLKRVRGNQTDVWTWQGWLLAKQAARAIERAGTDTTIRGDSFDLLAVVVGRTGAGAQEVLRTLQRNDLIDRERTVLIGCASTLWDRHHEWRYVVALSEQLMHRPNSAAAGALSGLTGDDYSSASDEELGALFEKIWKSRMDTEFACFERSLVAIGRRPRLAEAVLPVALSDTATRFEKRSVDPTLWDNWNLRTLEPIAVLCAIRGEAPPILIQTSSVPWVHEDGRRLPAEPNGTLVWQKTGEAPTAFIAVKHNYEGEYPLIVKHGGDNRGSRFERLRVVITDARGRSYHSPTQSMNFGGMFSIGEMRSNPPIHYTIQLNRYTHRPPPGTYQLRVQYHDRLQIAVMEDVSGLIIFESEPVELIVE